MSGIYMAVATAGAAVVGGVVSRNASKRAADTAGKTSDAQLAHLKAAEGRARADIDKYIPEATDRRNLGYQQSMDFLSSAAPQTVDFLQQGNVGAQNVMAGALPQMNNAILGNAVNYDFAAPQSIDYKQQMLDMLAGAPKVWEPEPEPVQGNNTAGQSASSSFYPWNRNGASNGGNTFDLLSGGNQNLIAPRQYIR